MLAICIVALRSARTTKRLSRTHACQFGAFAAQGSSRSQAQLSRDETCTVELSQPRASPGDGLSAQLFLPGWRQGEHHADESERDLGGLPPSAELTPYMSHSKEVANPVASKQHRQI